MNEAGVLRYRPTAVMLPDDSPVTREFFDRRQHLPGRPPLEAGDYAGFETHTVFNDVFIHTEGRALCALGPPLVNLAKVLLPMQVSVRSAGSTTPDTSQELVHRYREFDRVAMHRFALPPRLHNAQALSVHFRFANGLERSVQAWRQQLDPVFLQFVTLQKNNPIDWIVDWIHYANALGVERFLLYDNGSDDIDGLIERLAALDSPAEIVIIDWPFPYGPVRSYYNQFCQAAQNNHAHQCFSSAVWTGHFDVDEYLTGEAAEGLPRMLNNAGRFTGLLRFDSHWVPRLADSGIEGMPTVRDFPWREIAARGKAHKYIVRNRALVMANTHNARVRLGYWRKRVKPARAAFLHYKALTTEWRSYATRGEQEHYDAARHCRDETVISRVPQRAPR